MEAKNSLGSRMKEQYEFRTRLLLPRRTYTIIRLDGVAWHTYTRGLDKPYDSELMTHMSRTTAALCQAIQGAQFGYTQSDEISILLTDFATIQTDAWFNGNIQKLASVSASMATAHFNQMRGGNRLALFDSRAFTIPDPVEVCNYFVWRQQDATRNSIQSAAQAHFSQAALHGLNSNQLQEKLFSEAGINWNDYPENFKRGTLVYKADYKPAGSDELRSHWVSDPAPIFTNKSWLPHHVPQLERL